MGKINLAILVTLYGIQFQVISRILNHTMNLILKLRNGNWSVNADYAKTMYKA